MMRFSVVGSLAGARDLMVQLTSAGWQPGPHVLSGPLAASVAESALPVSLAASAEDVFTQPGTDLIVVAIDDAEQSLQLVRQIAQADCHVIILPPDDASAAYAHELHLLFDETSRAVIPVVGRMRFSHPFHDSPVLPIRLEQLRQISLEAEFPADATAQQLTDIQCQLIDMACASGAPYSQVTVIQTTAPDGRPLARTITLAASAQSRTLIPPATIRLQSTSECQPAPVRFCGEASDGQRLAFDVQAQLQIASLAERLCIDRSLCVAWLTAFDATMEISDASQRSIAKRRTIDVHFDSGGERSVFKGQMAAIGCGLLLLTLFAFVVLLMLDQAFRFPVVVKHIVEIGLLTPLVLFSLLQLLLPLTRTPSGGATRPETAAKDE
ncbi:MAG: hypothetical protein KDA96_19160 [Planctomycetaceae bacterium]|nr:hypothetical protein [Planctomycetaceae bacterium]